MKLKKKVMLDFGNMRFVFHHNTKYPTNNRKAQTYCDVYYDNTRVGTFVAECHKDDNFSKKIGKKIALEKALKGLGKQFIISKLFKRRIWEEFFKNN